MTRFRMPTRDRRLVEFTLTFPPSAGPSTRPITTRRAYAATHVVADAMADVGPDDQPVLDLAATLRFRHHIWECGLGVAEAMDTAQRGMGLGWPQARALIERTAAEARAVGGAVVAGATTDQLPPAAVVALEQVLAAYEQQVEAIEAAGCQVAIMPSLQLARAALTADDYRLVYGRLLDQVAEPVILHWLGEAFDPRLRGYWGHEEPGEAAETVLALCREHRAKIDGVKLSLLDQRFEEELRARLPVGIRLYTGDDFHYVDLIRGDGRRHSDALLGVFDPLAPLASHALSALDQGRPEEFTAVLSPTVPFARHLFAAPTRYYKTGIGLIAWLNGHQDHFRMVGGIESARSVPYLAELVRLADRAGVLRAPEVASRRLRLFLETAGIEQERR